MTNPAPQTPRIEPSPDLIEAYRFEDPVFVTRPSMPDRHAFQERIAPIWDTGWLTNEGPLHEELSGALADYLGTPNLSLCCNGTVALLIALQALRIHGGEVITTPFTFPATPHALYWNSVTPVFCDIDPRTYTLDPARIESLIGPETRAILPVHVFGNPCDVDGIQAVADKHGLRVIYDAAHVMGVRLDGRSLLEYGDCSILSFHATKLFSTIEGGAIVSGSRAERRRIEYLRNFGIEDEHTVIGPGINGKLNEFQAAFGLMQLEGIEDEIAARRRLTERYRARLDGVPGITLQRDLPSVRHNYAYFPIEVDEARYGMDRDALHHVLSQCNVHARKYFYPLCSTFSCYANLPSARSSNLPVANRVAERILCLPLYGTLAEEAVDSIGTVIASLPGMSS